MSSNQEQEEQEAGPSGISREETLALLGLDMSDLEQEEDNLSCYEVMEVCNEVMDQFERQRVFQSQLLQQSGGGLDTQTLEQTWEPLNLISNPLWIDRVVEWACANVISIPDSVKRRIL